MADKKVSVLLSAKDALSPAFASAEKSLDKMRRKAGDASTALGALNKQQSDVKGHIASQQALKETNAKLAENKKRLDASGMALRDAQAEQRRYQKGIAGAENTLRELDVELARNGKLTSEQRVAHVRATQALEQLRPAYKKATAEVATKRREDSAATRQMASLSAAADKERTRLQSLGSALKKTGVDTRNLSREQVRLSADATKASSALMRQERRIISVNKAQAKMAANREVRQGIKNRALGTLSATPLGGVMTTALTAAPFVAAGKKSIDYEASWADVKKVANFKNEKQDRDVQLAARKQAGDLGMSQQGMTEILAAAGQAGVANDRYGNVDARQLLRFGADASKASVALDISAKEAGDTMATLRTSMKLSQDGVISLLDVINAESNKMNAKASVVAGIMKRQGANAVLAGFDAKQVAGLSSALVASGDTEETGSTALKNITGRLTMGFAATKNQKRSLSMLGFDPGVLAKDMQRDAVGTLKKVLEGVNKQSPDNRKAVISQIFGEEVAGSVAKLAGNMQLLDQAMEIANDRTKHQGSLQNEYLTKTATREFKLNQMKARMDDAAIALGNQLLPMIDKLAPTLGAAAEGFADLLEKSESARNVLKGTAIAIGGLIALKATVGTFKFVKTLFSDLAQIGKLGKAKLGGATDHTTTSANRAAAALERLNRQMDRMGRSGGNASGNGAGRGRKGRKSRRGGNSRAEPEIRTPAARPRSKWRSRGGGWKGWVAGAAATAAMDYGLDWFSQRDEPAPVAGSARKAVLPRTAPAMASMLPAAGNGLSMMQTGAELLAPASKLAGRMFTPLAIAGGAINTTSVIMNGGSAAEVGGAVGNTGGALAGAAVGAAIGTAILPGIGTAVGGAIGGLAGSELGQKMGEVVGPYIKEGWEGLKGWFSSDDKTTPASDKVPKVAPKDLAKVNAQTLTPGIDAAVEKAKLDQPPPAPNIIIKVENNPRFDVKASGDPAQDNALAQKIKSILEVTQTKALHEALANGVDARMNASLSGQRSD